jgi:hypothetical protein
MSPTRAWCAIHGSGDPDPLVGKGHESAVRCIQRGDHTQDMHAIHLRDDPLDAADRPALELH